MFKKREAKQFRRKAEDVQEEEQETNITAKRQKVEPGIHFTTKKEVKEVSKPDRIEYESSRALASAADYRDKALVEDSDKANDER